MNLEYTNITTESTRQEIEKEIKRLEMEMTINKNLEQAIKLIINSMYGAFGNPYFSGYNVKNAESITLQGQELIKYAECIIEDYFKNSWINDTDTHEKLNIKVFNSLQTNVCQYIDTDSVYVSFKDIISTTNYVGEPMDFIKKIYEVKLYKYFNGKFNEYADRYGVKNIQNFEIELLAYSGFWLSKKKYVLNVAEKISYIEKKAESDDVQLFTITYKPCSKIKPTGVEIIQRSSPLFARDNLKNLLIYIFENRENFSISKFIDILKDLKTKFKSSDIENISMNTKVNKLDKYVINDITKIEYKLKCPPNAKASALYNFLLNKSQEHKNKYNRIKNGDAIKYFHIKNKYSNDEGLNMFAYHPNNYPVEFAPSIDYDMQFYKCIIMPINRFITVMGYKEINTKLFTIKELF